MTLETLQGMNLGMADVAASMTGKAKAAQPVVDPMQWWGAVSQQFQSIAAKTMQEMQQQSAATASAKTARAKPAAAKPRTAAKTGATANARKTTRRV
jgi:2-polyprenyl-6-methoxyphenol hydroxylase-like FAD-dependent oxidoreductase